MSAPGTKPARFSAVAGAVCSILLQRGTSDVRVTSVARSAGVSRAWIYKQFGTDISSLLDFAIREVAGNFAAMEHPRDSSSVAAWRASIEAAVHKSLEDVLGAPWALRIYFRYRDSPDAVGEAMRVIENRYIDGFLDDLPEPLRRNRRAARSFAVLFTNSRMNLLRSWSQDRVRRDVTTDEAALHLLDMVDAWTQRTLTA